MDGFPNWRIRREFYEWRMRLADTETSYAAAAKDLRELKSDVALLRAVQLLEYSIATDGIEPFYEAIKQCLQSDDVAVRSYVTAFLALYPRDPHASLDDSEIGGGIFAIPVIEEILLRLRREQFRDEFVLETEVFILYVLAELYIARKDYPHACLAAGEAVLLSLPLNSHAFTETVRLTYAQAAFRAGQLDVAQREYAVIIHDGQAASRSVFWATLNAALIQTMCGAFRAAADLYRRLNTAAANVEVATVGLQFISALKGQLAMETALQPCPSHLYDTLSRALLLLWNAEGQKQRGGALELLEYLKVWQPPTDTGLVMTTWLQCSALLRQGKPFLAAQRLTSIRPTHPLTEVLLLGATIEIALHYHGVDLEPLAHLTQQLQTAIITRKREEREGLAEMLLLWHPTAAAFVASSPFSLPELVDLALPAIFADGRPIHIYGKPVPSRIPFVQASLEYFGISTDLRRDQSTEKSRMDEVLKVSWGDGHRQRPVIPPCVLVYNLLRVSETQGHIWHMAAQELRNSNGLIPSTAGGNLRYERSELTALLEALLDRRLSIVTFREQVNTLKEKHVRA